MGKKEKDKAWQRKGYMITDMELGDDMDAIIYMYIEKKKGKKRT